MEKLSELPKQLLANIYFFFGALAFSADLVVCKARQHTARLDRGNSSPCPLPYHFSPASRHERLEKRAAGQGFERTTDLMTPTATVCLMSRT